MLPPSNIPSANVPGRQKVNEDPGQNFGTFQVVDQDQNHGLVIQASDQFGQDGKSLGFGVFTEVSLLWCVFLCV
jgi:hypothetical protein